MDIPAGLPKVDEFAAAGSREEALERLSRWINDELAKQFEANRAFGREHLGALVVQLVEDMVLEKLNAAGYDFGRDEYDGVTNYEDCYQSFSNGEEMGTGIVLVFRGFSCKVRWRDSVG